jgi:DNA polymerase-3 subunit epsilon
MRQIVLDTETTGLEPSEGHRIIEIGCVELINRRLTGNRYHQFIDPERDIEAGAIAVHGITNESLADKPKFRDVADGLLDFIKDSELIIHNAPFDVGFLNHELALIANKRAAIKIEERCAVVDTLKLARGLHPGQKNDLDSLCRRYGVDNSSRTLHGALLDAEILADVYLAMTGGQATLFEDARPGVSTANASATASEIRRYTGGCEKLLVLEPTAEELAAHEAWVLELEKKSGGRSFWK